MPPTAPPSDRTPGLSPVDASALALPAIELVSTWLSRADEATTNRERRTAEQLRGVIEDEAGVSFAMKFVDRVVRPEDHAVAAHQLSQLVDGQELPGFLSPIDRLLLRAGARLAPVLPGLVMPLAVRRMRQLVGHLVVDAEPSPMAKHLGARREEGFRLNVNLLGEAVLGDAEADRRLSAASELLQQPDVDYVSVKVSAVVSQLNPWAFEDSLARVVERLRPLFTAAAATLPPTFINLDMEEYHDLELTMAVFMQLLDAPELHEVDAGIVLQAYLPDSFDALQEMVAWANQRKARTVDGRPGGEVKIRLVKGANLAMERVDAAMHGWELAPYRTKAETDANYKRCLDWVMTPERLAGVRIGVASHNLFDVAWAHLLAGERAVAHRIEFEMLEGMAPGVARAVRDDGDGLLLYTPVVAPADFDVAISYLFRRLEENASDENFIRHLFSLSPGSAAFESEASKFTDALGRRHEIGAGPQRTQDRWAEASASEPATSGRPASIDEPFVNEPDTDPALPANRRWAHDVVSRPFAGPSAEMIDDANVVDHEVATARAAFDTWSQRPAADRRAVLHAVGAEIARRRGDLINAMVHEANKTFAQADVEISEAVDFARWYGDRAVDLEGFGAATFEALGVIAVVPPWNFPVAIPAGGVLSALAAGNTVIFKPAPEVPRCAEIVAECCWAGGVPPEALRFVRTPDDDIGRHLITHPDVDAVILTGAYETAELFRSWQPDLRIFAETSGKNALVITPNADLDEAVADLVDSAFGHAGQKCSAASLAICVGDVFTSDRFRRQLVDAVSSLVVGPATELETSMGPMIGAPTSKLERGLTTLDAGEEWLVRPERLADNTWTPGVRVGVAAGSWFHQTECFGPVLGVMFAADLDEAIRLQNATSFGLTGGIHSLDPAEVDHWLERVEIGNAYVNRVITGAIVQRQPFGGWKRSSIGPGAKAGGPNYIAQLGRWRPDEEQRDDAWLARAEASDQRAWATEFAVEHDPSGLFCESNVFRYRPLGSVALRVEAGANEVEVQRVRSAAATCGVELIVSSADTQSSAAFASSLERLGVDRIRQLGPVADEVRDTAADLGLHIADDPVTAEGRIELQYYLREQAISTTLHRHGNVLR